MEKLLFQIEDNVYLAEIEGDAVALSFYSCNEPFWIGMKSQMSAKFFHALSMTDKEKSQKLQKELQDKLTLQQLGMKCYMESMGY